VGAAVFVLEHPDILLIAKGAEAWRRTMAGDWAYPHAPVEWSGAEFADGLDALLRVRVQELLAADDPVTASRSLLAAWCGISGALPDKIRKRMQALIKGARSAGVRARRDARALEAARLLLRAGAPSAFVPALATLVAVKQKL
jgi:hypothetical protein